MLRVRCLLYIGLMIYLLDLYAFRADALKLPKLFGKKKKEEKSSKEIKEEAFYRMAFQDKSRETKSGEHLKYAFNPHCGWTKIFGKAGLQSNCLLDKVIGPYRFFRKYYLVFSTIL